jgi:predicted metal-binding membrane protein
MSSQAQLSKIQKNIVIAGILSISIVSWFFLFIMDSNMSSMNMDIPKVEMNMDSKTELNMDSKTEMNMDSKTEMNMDSRNTSWLPNTYWIPPMDNNWGSNDFYQLIMMWIIMMIAMMSPSIIPAVLMFATVNQAKKKKNLHYTPTYIFYFGYLIAWILFSIGISIIQYPLHQVSLINPMMSSINNYLSGIVLVIAGIYQLTPYKNACLDKCRSPLSLVMTNWRDGNLGALRMGLGHGFYCVFCCWFLMAILLVAGVMNLYFVVALTIFVLLEKLILTPKSFEKTFQKLITRIPGVILIIVGIYYIIY